MRYALILAGGSGTRLWPMSTQAMPKQLIPFVGGRSLIQIALERLRELLPDEQVYVCAGESMREPMLRALPGFDAARFIAEPQGRDTLNAVALGSAVLGRDDPDALVAVFTADHIIEPIDDFRRIVDQGYRIAEERERALVTFGIAPTHAATGYGYLELGRPLEITPEHHAFVVSRFKEKPDLHTAQQYLHAGPNRYLWNSGMFVWRADTLMDCVRRYVPDNHAGLMRIVEAWDTPRHEQVLRQTYADLKKISVDYAVMEPASQDKSVTVAAVPMPLRWLDVGSWPSFMQTLDTDESGNAASGCRSVLLDSSNTLAVSDDPQHLIAAIGCDDLIIVRTAKATLVCKASQAEHIKQLHAQVAEQFGGELV
jgi:mannose-1-phosphate guanylyltransferase